MKLKTQKTLKSCHCDAKNRSWHQRNDSSQIFGIFKPNTTVDKASCMCNMYSKSSTMSSKTKLCKSSIKKIPTKKTQTSNTLRLTHKPKHSRICAQKQQKEFDTVTFSLSDTEDDIKNGIRTKHFNSYACCYDRNNLERDEKDKSAKEYSNKFACNCNCTCNFSGVLKDDILTKHINSYVSCYDLNNLESDEKDKNAKVYPNKFACNCNCSGVYDPDEFRANILNDLEETNRRQLLSNYYESDPTYDRCPNITLRASDARIKTSLCSCGRVCQCKRKTSSKSCYCNIDDVSRYRRTNYAQTHSPKLLTDNIKIPLHTCVYPYELNYNFDVVPSNPKDGAVRCIICNLPLITGVRDFERKPGCGIDNFEWEYMKKRQLIRNRLQNYVPQEIYLKIPISLTEPNSTIIEKYKNPKFKYCFGASGLKTKLTYSTDNLKNIYPADSCALRFQKGMPRSFI